MLYLSSYVGIASLAASCFKRFQIRCSGEFGILVIFSMADRIRAIAANNYVGSGHLRNENRRFSKSSFLEDREIVSFLSFFALDPLKAEF